MKSFLLKGKRPIIRWSLLPNNTFFEGKVPDGYNLAFSPEGDEGYIVIDVDRHGDIDGFLNIPENLKHELNSTLNYNTKNKGRHYWFKYSGNKPLGNKASGLGIDLRTNKGYVVWYPKYDLRDHLHEIKETTTEMNQWLEKLFSYVK